MALLFALFYAVSGFCILALETIWIRELGLRIGSTVQSATLVIATFFLCAAAGNLLGGRLARTAAQSALRYGLLEIATALAAVSCFALKSVLPTPHAEGALALASHWLYTLVLVGPASFLAGATFPLLTQAFVQHTGERTRIGGWFYALNLMGAAAGVVGGGLLLPQTYGYRATFLLIAGLLLCVGIAAVVLARAMPANTQPAAKRTDQTPVPEISRAAAIVILGGSGVLSLMLEILCLNYFQLLTVSSIYSVSAILFAYVVNLGLGAALAALLRRWLSATTLLRGFLFASALLALAYPLLLQACLKAGILPPVASPAQYAWQTAAAGTLLLLPLLLAIGGVFPLAWEFVARGDANQGQALGKIVSLNKLGAALGTGCAPFLLVPLCGLPGAFTVIGAVYGVLAAAAASKRRTRLTMLLAVCIAAVILTSLHAPPIRLMDGSRLLALYSGSGGITAVAEDPTPSRQIILNQTYTLNGTNRALLSQRHQSWLPLALAHDPQRLLYIGLASGTSAGAALDFPVQEVVAAELIPEVVRAAREHFSQWNNRIFEDSRARIVINDGRYVVASTSAKFDLIICDLLLPSQEGTSSLYSRDFFEEVSRALAPGGRFCLWLPAYQLDEQLAGIVINTFVKTFPQAIAIRGNLDPRMPIVGLLGAREKIDLSDEFLTQRLQSDAVKALAAKSPFLRSLENLRLILLGDLQSVRDQFAAFPLNTDDAPLIAFFAPRRLAEGQALRGYTFLKWIGSRFLAPHFPSCELRQTEPETLVQGIRAGNYYFAASIASFDLPGSLQEQMRRADQTEQYLKSARELSPRSLIEASDLGQ